MSSLRISEDSWIKNSMEKGSKLQLHLLTATSYLFYYKSHNSCKYDQLEKLSTDPTLSNGRCARIAWL